MKVAFHFDADFDAFDGFYGYPINEAFFRIVLSNNKLQISSKIFIGDLLLHDLAMESEKTKSGLKQTFNKEKYLKIFDKWLFPENLIWHNFPQENIEKCLNRNVYVICLESIDMKTAFFLSKKLSELKFYLGAFEVDDVSSVHWAVYSNALIPAYRLVNNSLHIFWDGIVEDSKDQGDLEHWRKLGFKSVNFEALNGKFTIFDKYHNFEHAKRIADWNRRSGNLLAFIADAVVTRLSDTAPDLGNKLWAAIETYESAETNEQLAQVTTTCRRIIEYVTDCIFPPTGETRSGFKLGRAEYRNRLLAFVDEQHKSNTSIDLICVNTEAIREQIEKLTALVNKGVHAEVYRAETRRCLLRTIILLDDIISLKIDPFEIKNHIDIDRLKDMLE